MKKWTVLMICLFSVVVAASGGFVSSSAAQTTGHMTVLSYYWPAEQGKDARQWDIQAPTLIDIMPGHTNPQLSKYWRDRGKKLLVRLSPAKLFATRDPLSDMEQAVQGEWDGISFDEFLLGSYSSAAVKEMGQVLAQFRQKHPDKIIASWIGYAIVHRDPATVQMLTATCDYVIPEIYRTPGAAIDFSTWTTRYPASRAKTLFGIWLNKEKPDRNPAAYSVDFVRNEISEARKLGVAGVALMAPCYLNAPERRELDGALK